jgi:hypothetical protein
MQHHRPIAVVLLFISSAKIERPYYKLMTVIYKNDVFLSMIVELLLKMLLIFDAVARIIFTTLHVI